jgi:hypothetical protein
MPYLPNELVDFIYKQSQWLLVGDKKRKFKDIHSAIKVNKERSRRRCLFLSPWEIGIWNYPID